MTSGVPEGSERDGAAPAAQPDAAQPDAAQPDAAQPDAAAPQAGTPAVDRTRLSAVTLDQASIRRSNTNIEHEREVAIYDLLDRNQFAPDGRDDGPFTLRLGLVEDRLVLVIEAEAGGAPPVTYMLSLAPLRRIIKDYFLVCESYYQAIRTAPPSRIQAIDMGRRGLHDEGSRVLIERLKGKVAVDHETARRLFTLVCALHWKG